MTDTEFEIMITRKLNKERRESGSDMNENTTKDIDLIKKNQMEILETNSSTLEIKNSFDSIINQVEERIPHLQNNKLEVTQSDKNKKE